MRHLDHIMYAVPELDEGVAHIAGKLGVRPVTGGPHPGKGTHNALLSLGNSQYLEIIAPDPAQSLAGNLGGSIATAATRAIRTWAVAADDLNEIEATCRRQDLTFNRVAMSRKTPAGPVLNWELMYVGRHEFGDLFPFFIDWLESPHPAATTLQGGELAEFTVTVPDPAAYQKLLDAFEIGGVTVVEGEAAMKADIKTGSGERVRL